MNRTDLVQALTSVCDNHGMAHQFEFADSEISRIHRTAEGCNIEFSAALVSARQANETPGREPQRRYSNGLRLVLAPCPPAVAGEAQAFGLLASGWLQRGLQRLSVLPVPSDYQAEVLSLHLQFANGLQMQLSGSSLRCEASEQARQVEVLAC
ncbi:hypothetical protein [Comamonas sp.]|uniref:hypothetical protein n=1 Tax=Comamonas sp. TaxID=34028 RepID=UPI0028977FD6|nr:hypothetical protein [Comamonas sp.]